MSSHTTSNYYLITMCDIFVTAKIQIFIDKNDNS